MKTIKLLTGLFFILIGLYMGVRCFQRINIDNKHILNNKILVMNDLDNMRINTDNIIDNIISIDFDSIIVITPDINKSKLKKASIIHIVVLFLMKTKYYYF